MSRYLVKPERSNLHGVLSKKIKPILTINPGDSVVFTTLEGDWRIEPPSEPSSGSGVFVTREYPYDAGHALCGPIAIEGAKPGMTLEVQINSIVPDNWGWSRIGGGDPDHLERIGFLGDEYFLKWDIDIERGICKSHLGHSVTLKPFLGVLSVAPQSEQDVLTHLPGSHGANLDCKEITVGSKLYLPIYTEGALFSAGDGHAKQGDGELGGTAIECPIREAELMFNLSDIKINNPICNSPRGWITFGFDRDITKASYIALMEMVALMQRIYGFSKKEALAMSSLVVDMHVTQIVNGVRGAHAILPHGSIH
jgi:acetamidase/formamidase